MILKDGMTFHIRRRWLMAGLIGLLAGANTTATAQVFFADPTQAMGFFDTPAEIELESRPRVIIHGRRASPHVQSGFCVRSCDGRFFPLPQAGADVRSCQALCPAAEMQKMTGSSIEDARNEQGKPYKSLANAFRFQRELVPKCSCNAQAATGMARIAIQDDATLRSGDIVAEEKGFSVADVSGSKSGRRNARITFRPLVASKARSLGLAHAAMR